MDLGSHIDKIARHVLGPENRRLSTASQLRFGNNGSVAVEIDGTGKWFDHEHGAGGGPLELIHAKLGLSDGAAMDWLSSELGIGEAASSQSGGLPIGATYDYHNEDGKLLFQVVRLEPKDFRQRRPGGAGRWEWSTKGVRMVPYRLPELLRAIAAGEIIYIAEGEKAVEALRGGGLAATCSPRGAGKWRSQYAKFFRDADVVVLPDNDDTGRAHADAVVRSLTTVARSVKNLDLAVHEPRLPHKGDAHDWFALGRTAEDIGWLIEGAEPLAENVNVGPQSEDAAAILTLSNWLTREIAEPVFLLGDVLSTTSRVEIIGPTGLGKTNLGLAMATAVSAGQRFLHWQGSGASRRVLYVDGEMSRRLMQARLRDAVRRHGANPETLFILSREDFQDFQPLNLEAGQQFIDTIIKAIGGVDLVVFDNVQALLVGDMKDEEPWQQTLPWVRDLTRRNIGQIWFHHTGHNETHGYGTKTREWQLDTVALMEAVERPDADLAFAFKFTKARERTPDNRGDFEPAVITLSNDEWISERGAVGTSKKPVKERALELLVDALARGEGVIPVPHERIPPDTLCIKEARWREIVAQGTVSEATEESQQRVFRRHANDLLKARRIGICKPWVWPVRT